MKKLIYTAVIAFLFVTSVAAQKIGNLNGIYYQAVAIDEDGKEIVGLDIDNKPINAKTIGVRFTITKGLNGAIQWEETHSTNTDKFGLFNLIIGKGVVTGKALYKTMLEIPWIDADQFLKVEISTLNDGNYKLVSNQQFMSVPYSFYTDDIADNAITTEKILDSAILNRDVSTNAIDSRTIVQETIQAEDIDSGAVTTSELLDSTVLNRDLSTSSVDSRIILDSSIATIDVKTAAINSRTILNNTIINEDIADSTIDLTQKVTGILPIKNGGTGNTFLGANAILLGSADSTSIVSMGQATDGQIPVGVTGGAPTFKVLAARNGILLTQTQDSLIITSGVTGITSAEIDSVDIDFLQFLSGWISPPFELPGAKFGDVIYSALDVDLQGCQISTYVSAPNTVRVSIFNGTGNNVDLGLNRKLRLMIVK